ncbi:hypothetical protein ACFUIY_09600 [Streptomyces griseorubiginosus]|nr:hypothetical protein [Streptomyces griseorubiginosus]
MASIRVPSSSSPSGRQWDMTTTERVLFALVAIRELAPASSLAAAE